ncbi:MAG TPA: hypothetical protein VIM57_04920, partial [Luteolibacter sp.]
MKLVRPLSHPFFREFWHGLTTPDFGVLKMAAIILLTTLGILTAMAVNFRHRIEAGTVDWRRMRDEFGRSSVLAMTGAARATDPSGKNLVFVGPSSLRCWLPGPNEADEVASSAAGGNTRVLAMCANRQSYAVTAAFIDRFGADFDGWFVIGVGRQSIARTFNSEDTMLRRQQTQMLAFSSDVLTRTSSMLGTPQQPITGWELWDHRGFHRRYELGLKLLPFRTRRPYLPHLQPTKVPFERWSSAISSLDEESLQRHLRVLEEIARSVRAHGRARVALVETPWVDHYTPSMQTPEWRRDEDLYQRRMREWSQEQD